MDIWSVNHIIDTYSYRLLFILYSVKERKGCSSHLEGLKPDDFNITIMKYVVYLVFWKIKTWRQNIIDEFLLVGIQAGLNTWITEKSII